MIADKIANFDKSLKISCKFHCMTVWSENFSRFGHWKSRNLAVMFCGNPGLEGHALTKMFARKYFISRIKRLLAFIKFESCIDNFLRFMHKITILDLEVKCQIKKNPEIISINEYSTHYFLYFYFLIEIVNIYLTIHLFHF